MQTPSADIPTSSSRRSRSWGGEIDSDCTLSLAALTAMRPTVSPVITPLSPPVRAAPPIPASPGAATKQPKTDADETGRLARGLSKYTVIGRLGKGSSGEVLLTTDQSSGERFAIKVIKLDRLAPDALQCVTDEVRVLKLIRHDHMACLREVVYTRRHCCLVMEWVDGCDLRKHWRCEDEAAAEIPLLGEANVVDIFRQLLVVVDFLHANHIVHRDIKLDNIMVTASGLVKLVDFGFSTTFSPGTPLRQFCGTPYYAAPEIFRHIPYYTEVDVWSLGVVLYILVTGDMPFASPQAIVAGQYVVPSHVSVLCTDVIKSLLAPQRPPVHQILKHPWLLSD